MVFNGLGFDECGLEKGWKFEGCDDQSLRKWLRNRYRLGCEELPRPYQGYEHGGAQ